MGPFDIITFLLNFNLKKQMYYIEILVELELIRFSVKFYNYYLEFCIFFHKPYKSNHKNSFFLLYINLNFCWFVKTKIQNILESKKSHKSNTCVILHETEHFTNHCYLKTFFFLQGLNLKSA